MSKANTGKGKGPEAAAAQKGGNDQAKKNAKAISNPGEVRGQAAGGQRGGRGGGGAGRGGQQAPAQQQQQQGQRPGGRGGNDNKGATAKQPDYLSKYPRLELEKENKQLDDFTAKIDAAYGEMEEIRRRIDAIQEERKAIQNQELESRDSRSEHSLARKKLIDERTALRAQLDQQKGARSRKLEELNRQKKQLPISKDIKDSKKVVALNLEHLEARERAVEAKIKSSISTGQDRASSKELTVIATQRRLVKEWAKFAEEAEAPVNPALDARLKELEEELKKLNEGEREVKNDYNRLKDALQSKGDELGAAKLERSAIARRIEGFKKERDAVYAVIREKRKEHNNKIKELQKADREKKAQLDKEKRIKLKKEQRNKALQELSQAYKDELALCDRLTAVLVNRQSKQKAPAKSAEEGESVEKKEDEEEQTNEEHEDEEKEEAATEEGAEEGESGASTSTSGAKKKSFQFTMATHIDFELLSVQPPTNLEEIPDALASISRKKAFYERLAADKLEQRKKLEAQYDAELQALEAPAKKASENGTAAGANKKNAAGAAKKPAGGAAKKPAAKEAKAEEKDEEEGEAEPSTANEDDDGAAADAAAEEDGDE